MTSAIPSQPWHCKTAWTSRQCPVCWATTTPDSLFAPTPTPPGRSKTKQRKPWATSWSRSCEHKRAKNTGPEVGTSCPVLSKPFRTFLRVGHGVGQAVDPHFDPRRFGQKVKKIPEIIRFRGFSGAAGRIRTADLILTNYFLGDAPYRNLSYAYAF